MTFANIALSISTFAAFGVVGYVVHARLSHLERQMREVRDILTHERWYGKGGRS